MRGEEHHSGFQLSKVGNGGVLEKSSKTAVLENCLTAGEGGGNVRQELYTRMYTVSRARAFRSPCPHAASLKRRVEVFIRRVLELMQ